MAFLSKAYIPTAISPTGGMATASEHNRPFTNKSCHEEVFNAEPAGSRVVKIHDLPLTVREKGFLMHNQGGRWMVFSSKCIVCPAFWLEIVLFYLESV